MNYMPSLAQLRPAEGFLAYYGRRTYTGKLATKRVCVCMAVFGALAGAGLYATNYVRYGQYLVSTDDAYVEADYTTIAPKVSGYIHDVLVVDNQAVKAGQMLARIDDRDYLTARDQAKADLANAEAAIGNVDAQISLQAATIQEARSNVQSMQAMLEFASADATRYQDLAGTGFGTVQRAQQTQAAHSQAVAQLASAEAAVMAAERRVVVLETQRQQAVAERDHSAAIEHQAELNLSYTAVRAPVDGFVGERTLRIGQYVTAGTQLMAVVPLNAAYVVANYKETQLDSVQAGQRVTIEVDGLGGRKLHGHVDSLSPASGLEFALLPPDNATGNFTKIVQRIPVRITIDAGQAGAMLRSGMSVEPTIDTKPDVEASPSGNLMSNEKEPARS